MAKGKGVTRGKDRANHNSAGLLRWYSRHARSLPWRAPAGVVPDPYPVWLSEIMLQQTTVATVGPYFEKFLALWPGVDALAAADLDAVLRAWAGLGYYNRARNLHRCAQVVVAGHGGRFPDTQEALQALPGIGVYTAAAIAAIAFGRRTIVVDANIERIVARLFALETPLPGARKEIRQHMDTLTPARRAGDFAQAMMDLGASVCRPKKPDCARCPFRRSCQARASGVTETFPRRLPKKPRPTRRGAVFWVERTDGAVLLRKRPDKGLLACMTEVPSGSWCEQVRPRAEVLSQAPLVAQWSKTDGQVKHTFTHFHLELDVYRARVGKRAVAEGFWVQPENLDAHALPGVMKKVVALVGADRV